MPFFDGGSVDLGTWEGHEKEVTSKNMMQKQDSWLTKSGTGRKGHIA